MSKSFPTPTAAEWRALAEKALKDRPLESLVHLDADSLAVRPLYAAATGVQPLFAPRSSDAAGRAWDVRALVQAEDAGAANAAVLAELEGGAASVVLGGPHLDDAAWVGRALDGVALELAPAGLEAGHRGPEAADALATAAKGAPRARLMFHMDPVSAFAASGGSGLSMEDHLALAAETAARHAPAYPEATHFLASGRVAHEAGGSMAQELAFAAANAVVQVKAGTRAGLPLDACVRGIVIGLSVDQSFLDSLAKIRAMRLIWRSIAIAFGVEAPAVVEVRSSRRMLAARDPWPNLLRLSAAGFAGAVGGADAITLEGFTSASGRPDAFARRQARNTQLVLMEEAHLGRVDDPASGSWFLDQRTRELAEAGWAEFQVIEAEGGILAALRGEIIQPRIARSRQALESLFQQGASHLVGVTRFVDPNPLPAAADPATPLPAAGGADACVPLEPVRFAAPFEAEGEL